MKGRWPEKTLAEICEIDSTLVDPRDATHQGRFHIGAANIESESGKVFDLKTARDEGLISGKFLFDERMVLYSKIRPYLKKVARPTFQGLCSADIYPLLPFPNSATRDYLFYLLLTPEFTDYAIQGSARAGMPKVNRDHLFAFRTQVPPLAEQRRIVGILDEAFAGIAVAQRNAQQNLQNARALFESHLQAIFTQRGDGWVTKTVKEIAVKGKGSIRTGPFGSQLLHSEFVDEGVAVLGIDNAVANEFRWGKSRFITAEKFRQLERFRVHPGDVVITIMGTCGRCAIVPDDIPTAINTKHLCCVTLDRAQCLPSYLHLYFLLAPQARGHLAKHAKGAIMAGLNMGIIQELPVLLPPTNIQASIVNAADTLREKTQRLAALYQQKLTALDELKKSLLARAFAGELTS